MKYTQCAQCAHELACDSVRALELDSTRFVAAQVGVDLCQLGLGVRVVRLDNGCVDEIKPVGIGSCRAGHISEAAWPVGAELCALVRWYPDPALARDCDTGKVPAGAEQHWSERLAATTDALESIEYVVERNRPPQSPYWHSGAELLVYRMAPGVPPVRLPADAWAGAEPHPPHFQRSSWYPDPIPHEVVNTVLEKAGLRTRYTGHAIAGVRMVNGTCLALPITQTVWPPEAEVCALVRWWPADEFKTSETSTGTPAGADAHWAHHTTVIQTAMEEAGYTVRRPARPWDPAVDESAEFFVYRMKQSHKVLR